MIRSAISAFCATLCLALLASPAQAGNAPGPAAFGSAVLGIGSTPYDAQWTKSQSPALGRGTSIAAAARNLDGLERLRFVNTAVNKAIQFRADTSNWKSEDYWATAAQTLTRGTGDCEDYAIAKMQLLRAAGVPAADMFLVIGNDATAGAHAVLLVRLDDRYWVLNNLQSELRTDTQYAAFRPVFTLSSTGRWLHGYAPGASKSGPLGGGRASGSSLAAVMAAQASR